MFLKSYGIALKVGINYSKYFLHFSSIYEDYFFDMFLDTVVVLTDNRIISAIFI